MPPSDRYSLTLAQLEEFDDLLTDSLVDRIYYWATIRKVKHIYHANRGVKTNAIVSIVVEDVVRGRSVAKALERFSDLPGIKAFVKKHCKNDSLKSDFNKHSRRYLSIYLPDASFEVSTTYRYSLTENEACILARRRLSRGETMKYLTGVMFKISPEEEASYIERQNDFSIIHSSRVGGTSILLGPARFINHDCNPNAKFVTSNKENVQIVVLRDVELGQEITVSYADGYFGHNNQDCLCQSCENASRNGWGPDNQNIGPQEIVDELESTDMMRTRSKRKSTVGGALGPPQPDKKAKRKLNKLEVMTPPDSDRAVSEDLGYSLMTSVTTTYSEAKSIPSTPKTSTTKVLGLNTPQKTDETKPVVGPVIAMSVEDAEVGDIAESLLALAQSPGFHRPLASSPNRTQTFDREISGFGCPIGTVNENLHKTPSTNIILASQTITVIPKQETKHCIPLIPQTQNTTKPNPQDLLTARETTCFNSNMLQGTEAAKASILADDSDSELSVMSETTFTRLDKVVSDIPVLGQETRKHIPKKLTKRSDTLRSARRRTAGDYLKAPDKESRECSCLDCGEKFIHRDPWYIPRSCQRCERHSKIYGLVWPKTIRRKGDAENIVDDPRKVQRYVTANEHRKELKRLQQEQNKKNKRHASPSSP